MKMQKSISDLEVKRRKEGVSRLSQSDLVYFVKFVLAFCGFIGTGLFGMIITGGDSDDIPSAGWLIGGLAFATLILFV